MTIEGHSPDCFVCGRLGVELKVEDGKASAEVVLAEGVTGPPSFIHGGVISALFDEVLGAAVSDQAKGAMTAHIEVDYRRPWPLGTLGRMTGQTRRLSERKLLATGELVDGDGELLAEARGLWVVPRR